MSLPGLWTYFGAMSMVFFVMGSPIVGMILGGIWVAILLGTFAYGGYQAVKGRKDDEALALEEANKPVHDPEFGIFNGYVCPNWDYNKRMRDGLGDTDFFPCDNEECPACYEHGKCAVGGCSLPAITPGDHGNWLCNGHDMERVAAHAKERKSPSKRELEARKKAEAVMDSITAAKKRTIEAAEKREAERGDRWEIRDAKGNLLDVYYGGQADAKAYAKELAMEPWDTIDGRRIRRPEQVPAFAHGYIHHVPSQGSDMVVWKWTDPETGKSMGARQMLAPEIGNSEYWMEKELAKMGEKKPVLIYGDYNKPRRESNIKLAVPKAYRQPDKGYM